MASIGSVVSPAAGAKARNVPSLCLPASFRHYRRSTTSKAPRKRTFLLTMQKYSVELSTPPGVASAFANNVAMLSAGPCFNDDAALCGGNGSGFGGGKGDDNGSNNGSNGWSSGNGDGENPWHFPPMLSRAFLGALAIVAAVAIFPAQSRATMQGQAATSPATSPVTSFLTAADAAVPAFGRTSAPTFGSSTSPSRPRSKVLHVPCKGSTLVVPLTGNGDTKAPGPRLAPWSRARVVDAPIQLTGNEVSVLELPQYRVRESMRV